VNAPVNLRLERTLQRFMDLGERAFFILLYAELVVRLWHSVMLQPSNGIVLVSEGLVVCFIIIRRHAMMVTTRPLDWLVALISTALPMLIKAGGTSLAPTVVGTTFMLIGLLFSISSKLTLRRSFGLAAANRGLVHAGPYTFIRHPIYAGYILGYVGFSLNNPLSWNFASYVVAISLFMWRIMAEERVLSQDPNFVAYMQRVPYRLVPGLF
jgi:protein-S-isoprenylcysteine O-methyltransferase Ste14